MNKHIIVRRSLEVLPSTGALSIWFTVDEKAPGSKTRLKIGDISRTYPTSDLVAQLRQALKLQKKDPGIRKGFIRWMSEDKKEVRVHLRDTASEAHLKTNDLEAALELIEQET